MRGIGQLARPDWLLRSKFIFSPSDLPRAAKWDARVPETQRLPSDSAKRPARPKPKQFTFKAPRVKAPSTRQIRAMLNGHNHFLADQVELLASDLDQAMGEQEELTHANTTHSAAPISTPRDPNDIASIISDAVAKVQQAQNDKIAVKGAADEVEDDSQDDSPSTSVAKAANASKTWQLATHERTSGSIFRTLLRDTPLAKNNPYALTLQAASQQMLLEVGTFSAAATHMIEDLLTEGAPSELLLLQERGQNVDLYFLGLVACLAAPDKDLNATRYKLFVSYIDASDTARQRYRETLSTHLWGRATRSHPLPLPAGGPHSRSVSAIQAYLDVLDQSDAGRQTIASTLVSPNKPYRNILLSTLKGVHHAIHVQKAPWLFPHADIQTQWRPQIVQYRTALLTSPKETFRALMDEAARKSVDRLDLAAIDASARSEVRQAVRQIFHATLWREQFASLVLRVSPFLGIDDQDTYSRALEKVLRNRIVLCQVLFAQEKLPKYNYPIFQACCNGQNIQLICIAVNKASWPAKIDKVRQPDEYNFLQFNLERLGSLAGCDLAFASSCDYGSHYVHTLRRERPSEHRNNSCETIAERPIRPLLPSNRYKGLDGRSALVRDYLYFLAQGPRLGLSTSRMLRRSTIAEEKQHAEYISPLARLQSRRPSSIKI